MSLENSLPSTGKQTPNKQSTNSLYNQNNANPIQKLDSGQLYPHQHNQNLANYPFSYNNLLNNQFAMSQFMQLGNKRQNTTSTDSAYSFNSGFNSLTNFYLP